MILLLLRFEKDTTNLRYLVGVVVPYLFCGSRCLGFRILCLFVHPFHHHLGENPEIILGHHDQQQTHTKKDIDPAALSLVLQPEHRNTKTQSVVALCLGVIIVYCYFSSS